MEQVRKRLAEVEAKIAELEAEQAKATEWGAAVGARHEWLKGLYSQRERLMSNLTGMQTAGNFDRIDPVDSN
jgi:hypothetical protein